MMVQPPFPSRASRRFFSLLLGACFLGLAFAQEDAAENEEPAEILEEGKVLVLNSDNFEDAVTAHAGSGLLVEFYAPWCGHCKQLEPQYAEAAERLRGLAENVRLGKCDATVHKDSRGRDGWRLRISRGR